MKVNQILVIVIACLFSALAAIGIYNYFDKDEAYFLPASASNFETVSYAEESEKTSTLPFDFTKAAKVGLPAVVHIRSTVERNGSSRQPNMQDFFEDFFGNRGDGGREQEPQRGIGFGSGVIISTDGYIITNNHVIEDANDIQVAFYNDEIIKAELIGTDPTTDIALVKVDRKGLPHLQFADSDQLEIGEWVAAIGNPAVGPDAFALKSTVTAGIVSATGRNIGINEEQYRIESFIQTDAVINKGNSGGALVNANGDLVGINTAISTPTGVYAGYGFAVPANLARKVVNDLREYGEVQRALLGVTYQDIKAQSSMGFPVESKEKEGLLIINVSPNSAADNAGLRNGDVIIALDGKNITDQRVRNFQEIIGRKRPGETVNIRYKRDGATKNASVVLMSAKQTTENYEASVDNIKDLGIGVAGLSQDELATLNIEEGVRVVEVNRGGLLSSMSTGEVVPGFIITRINNNSVNSAEDITRILNNRSTPQVKVEGFHEDSPNNRSSFVFQMR